MIMKKQLLNLCLAAFALLAFSACNSDEEESFNASDLIGKWYTVLTHIEDGKEFYEFNSDGTYKNYIVAPTVNSITITGTYTLSESDRKITLNSEETIGTRIYYISQLDQKTLSWSDPISSAYPSETTYTKWNN